MPKHEGHHLHYPESDKAVGTMVAILTFGPSIWIALILGFRGMAAFGMSILFCGGLGGIALLRRKIARHLHRRRAAGVETLNS